MKIVEKEIKKQAPAVAAQTFCQRGLFLIFGVTWTFSFPYQGVSLPITDERYYIGWAFTLEAGCFGVWTFERIFDLSNG
jgi:hypothetical protein